MKDKLETQLGFAIRSGNIVYGVDNIEAKISKIYLIIYDRRLSENGVNKLHNVSKKNQVDTMISEATIDDLINKQNCKAIGITSKDLAKAIQELNLLEEV